MSFKDEEHSSAAFLTQKSSQKKLKVALVPECAGGWGHACFWEFLTASASS